ncbi:MAG: hypothetical protein RIA65_12365, partial [Woeseia sp.]
MGRASVHFFTLFIVTLAGAGTAANASVTADGCAQLATTVGDNLQGAMRAYRLDGKPLANQAQVAGIAAGSAASCGTTAAVASRAFSTVMSRHGLQLSWENGGLPNPGDYCESHYISQCYPELQQGSYGVTAVDQAFVRDAWLGIQSGLARHMPFGLRSDIAFFQPEQLGTTLRISLDLSLAPSPLPERR